MSDTAPDQDFSPELQETHAEPLGPARKRRAYRFSKIKQEEYLDALREGGRRGKAARAIDIDPSTVWRHMRDEAGHLTEFGHAVLQAEAEADEEVETALYDAAVSGNVTAIQTWLYNRKADKWQPRTGAQAVAISGSVSSVTEVTLEVSAKEELLATILRMGANLTAPTFSPISTAPPEPTQPDNPDQEE
jgi:hypothetical protein